MSERQNAVVVSAQTLFEKLLDAETDARGYVATGRTDFLESFDRLPTAIPERHHLAELVANDDEQSRRLRAVEQLGAHESASLARYVALMRAGHGDQARAEVASADGKQTMDELRREIEGLESAATAAATVSLTRLKYAGRQTLLTLVWCSFFAIVFAAGAAWRIRRAIRGRVDLLVRKAQRLAEGEDIGPRIDGRDELSHLDRAFHDMAQLLAQRTGDLERYRLLAERTECLMLFARTHDGRILHANGAALDAYGYSLAEMQHLRLDELRVGEIPPEIAGQIAMPAHVSVVYEADQRRADGSVFPGEVTVEGRLIAGEDVQLSIVRDITERKRAQSLVAEALGAAQNAARAKTEFLATMSHEIRTPMNAVIGMTELVLQSPLTTEQREALQIVNESGTALLRIIDDVLDFSKIEAGKLSVEMIEFPFAKTVEAVAVTLAAQARERGLTLSVYVDPRAPATLFGDAGRIRQVLTNLVGNAVKFTHAGSVTLSAEIVGATKDWCEVRFRVADTGIGISAEQLAHIFEPFAQADTSTTRLYGGSGLGLSICQQLVELMGGKLRADSIQASGSTFSFSLRLRAGAASAPVARRELNVLIVEGASTTASELTRYLRAWGICPTIANSREAALTACASAHGAGLAFDLAIVDADGLNGDAFAIGESLATQARSAPIRRIGVASRDVGAGRNGTPLAGFDVFLLRPLRQSQLFDCLMNVTPGAPATRAETPSESSGRRILLAEDNAVNQRVALKQLDKLGYDVTVVETGRAALGAVINERYDAVLMDCFMPEMDGYAATAAIRRHQSHTGEHTPIIAMTANAQAGDREMCIAAGMDDYLAKPVVLAALRDVLERYCHPDDRARAQRSTPLTQTAAPASV